MNGIDLLNDVRGSLIIGDPDGSHLAVDPAGIVYQRDRGRARHEFSWDEIECVTLTVPAARHPLPGALAVTLGAMRAIAELVASFFTVTGDTVIGLEEGFATIREKGVDRVLPLSRGPFSFASTGGYSAESIAASQALLDRLVADAPSRSQLGDSSAVARFALRPGTLSE